MAAVRGRETKVGTRLEWALWLGGGVVMALPFLFDGAEWLAPVAAVPWMLALERCPRQAFLRGYAGGWVWVFLGVSWLNRVGLPATILAATYFALYPGVFAWALARVRHRGGVPLWIAAPLWYVACEWLAEHVTIFNVTWLFLGHAAWRATTLAQVAELGGISLVSALLTLTAAVTALALKELSAGGVRALFGRKVAVPAAAWAVAMGLALGYGTVRLRGLELREGPSVALVQGGVPLAEKLNPARADQVLMHHAALSREAARSAASVAVVAWPESAAAQFLELDPAARGFLGETAAAIDAPLVVGGIGVNPDPRPPSNSAFLIHPGGDIGARADKRVLVPGAETLLFLDHIPAIRKPISDWLSRTMHFRPFLEPGREAVLMESRGLRFGTLICYDDLVPGPSAELRAQGAEALLVLSNETWFGQRELTQHLAMASVRSIETRLPLARSTNDGATCVIDPAGRVVHEIPPHEPGVLVAPLPMTSAEPVPPAVRAGVRLAAGMVALGLLVPTLRQPRRRGADERKAA